ncbi:PaaI family thioesterase [Paracoccaceae bacterium GXU_MW_L88]
MDRAPHAETTAPDDRLPIDFSGACDLVGYRSSLTEGRGGACSLEVGPQHLNRVGLLHGGFVSMLLDNACGIAIRNEIGDIDAALVTMTLSVNFLSGVSEGRVVATGRVVGGGRSVKFAEAELKDDAGRLLATGHTSFKIIGKK